MGIKKKKVPAVSSSSIAQEIHVASLSMKKPKASGTESLDDSSGLNVCQVPSPVSEKKKNCVENGPLFCLGCSSFGHGVGDCSFMREKLAVAADPVKVPKVPVSDGQRVGTGHVSATKSNAAAGPINKAC